MTLTNSTIERLVEWCYKSDVIANIRAQAREQFFGDDKVEASDYLADTGSFAGR